MTEDKSVGEKVREFLGRDNLPADAPKRRPRPAAKPKPARDRKLEARKKRKLSAASRKLNARRDRGRKWKGR